MIAYEQLYYSHQHLYAFLSKLGIDNVEVLLGLILLLSLVPRVAICLKLDSPSSVLFYQERIGQGRRSFCIFKFPTMCVEADRFGLALTVRAGKRGTRLGRFLRQSKNDELPKPVNVLANGMSPGGLRPEAPQFTEFYKPVHPNRILK